MSSGPELLLIGTVAMVGVLHTIVPDHWVPITLIARQRGWSRSKTARVSLQAGVGHVLSTLLIVLVIWLAGVAVAARFGHFIDTVAGLALVAFGGWIAFSGWREQAVTAAPGPPPAGGARPLSLLAAEIGRAASGQTRLLPTACTNDRYWHDSVVQTLYCEFTARRVGQVGPRP